MTPVSFIIEVLFVAVFVASLVRYVRHRDPLSRDVMLVFASIAGLFAVSVGTAIFGSPPVWLSLLAVAALLAQPLLLLRVCVRTGDVRPLGWWIAAAAYAASLVPLVAIRPLSGTAALPALGVAVLTELAAAWFLGRAGLQRSGAARTRLVLAAAAGVLFAAALLGLAINSALPQVADVGTEIVRLIGLLAAVAYALAFLPIRWLERLWHAAAGFQFTETLIGESPADASEVWRTLTDSARRITGASHTFILLERGTLNRSVLGAADSPLDVGALASASAATELAGVTENRREATTAAWPAVRDALGDGIGRHDVLSAVSVPMQPEGTATLAWVTPRRSLFADDDRELLTILTRRAALFAERAGMLHAQESLNARLAASNDALERASAAKSDFLASMSHELRTPLSAIIGFSSLMREEPGEGEDVQVPREWVEHIHSSGTHLLSLINDVLDLAKVEAGRMELELSRFDLSVAVAELIGGMRPVADARQVELVSRVEPLEVEADRGRLRQILYNLVSNAIKFTPAGGNVAVTSAVVDGEVRITVADTGIGIAAEDQEVIFREFSQVGDAAARRDGTGLGLALTRRLTEAHGGRIELDSAPGNGSRFTVALPHQAAPEPSEAAETTWPDWKPPVDGPPAAAEPMPAASVQAGGILLIEDDPSAVRLIRTYLEGAGHTLRVCRDGESGLTEARRDPPSAILLDVLLPGMDGWEVLARLKADPALRDIPVVVLTAVDERQLGLSLGAVDYFLKPVDRDALLAMLARYRYGPTPTHPQVRVLVIDDDPAALTMVERALAPAGFQVELAATGEQGLERARHGRFDLVICDLVMPDLDGFQVVDHLHGGTDTRDLPILILTGHEISPADKRRLNGHILGVVSKNGFDVRAELSRWIARAVRAATSRP